MSLVVLLWACQEPLMLDPLAQPDVAVEVGVEKKAVAAGEELTFDLRITTQEGWTYQAFELDFGQLTAEELAAEVEDLSAGEQASFRFGLSGEEGSYVIAPQTFVFSGPDGQTVERESPRVFVDIGFDGPSSELEGLFDLPPAPESPWPSRLLAGLAGLAVLGLALFWWMRRPSREEPPPAPIPADREALDAWSEAYTRQGLDDHARALVLSQIYRRYLERVFQLPASAFTSAEVLREIKEELDENQWIQSKRLLSATDRIKYARRGGGTALFEALDQDFRELISTTRWRLEPKEDADD